MSSLLALVLALWQPCGMPSAPTPDDEATAERLSALLQEAQADAGTEGRADEALEKFVRYFRESREVAAQGGVRLSFALGYWHGLGLRHPPAMAALEKARNEARDAFRKGGCDQFERFHEFMAIDRQMADDAATVKEFLALHAKDRSRAGRIYNVAEPALLRAGEFKVAGAYLDPMEDWAMILQHRALQQRFRTERPDSEHDAMMKAHEEKSFTHETTTLIALLVVNERRDEAEEVARRAKGEWDDKLFHAAIERALGGQVPDAWP